MVIENTGFYSSKIGCLAKGCRQCVKGEKLVLFITGLCPRKCYYCPLSDEKYGRDVIYANERPVKNAKAAIVEAELCSSRGAGITGGDPLARMDRTVRFIKALKKRFGQKFHTHLYTSFNLVDENKLRKLYDAGLDEIRFHPDIDDDNLWCKIGVIRKFDWDVGIEIPAIPGKLRQMKKMVDFFNDKIDFLNLNELEVADNKISKLGEMGFITRDMLSYSVKGSEGAAYKIMKYCIYKEYNLDVHYCTAKLKDTVQLGKRIKRRAKKIAKSYDIVDEEGILVRGAIHCRDLAKVRKELMKEFDIPGELIDIDDARERLLTSVEIVEELKEELKKKGLKPVIVEEYPTWDRLQLTVNYL
ncbi:radical SAM protein [Candidatus Woesearchaeota archaeon]|nr:radical SAM protein [Candidatus Woesearchaeota archaeon]